MPSRHTLLVFIDGLGLGPDDPAVNPVHSGACPHLERLLREAVPVDASLDVPGTPQSATGQATLLTGVNAAKAVGRHVEGFPGPELKELVRAHNVFDQLIARGFRCTFANAYFLEGWTEPERRRFQSVTTVATLKAFGKVRDTALMLEGKAVYQDLTRESLRRRGYTGPLVTPRESALHLMAIAAEHDFTLFEYFQTDRKMHGGDASEIRKVLGQLDEFLGELLAFPAEPGRLLLITSDHGGIEDLRTRSHTLNPVPLIALGEGAEALRKNVRRLEDFVPALMRLYPSAERDGAGRPGR
ncbi:MAG: hypothetical protein JXB04_01305 [Kiritimatiellae bacterium]|nr:hypothetical protein [Kiritimatiellia bacterium]